MTTTNPTATFASFAKLRDGAWGVRINLPTAKRVISGDPVAVKTRAGPIKSVTLGRMVCNAAHYQLFEIAADAAGPAVTADAPAVVAVPSNLLHYDANTRTLIGEVSDLRGHIESTGLVRVRSERTGAVEEFRLHKVDKDRDGDATAWEYLNDERGLKLVLIND